jgi:F0F1-type ATP synthase assembly protein I
VALRPRSSATPTARAFEGAFEAAIGVVLGIALGYYCDRWLGTEPVFLFVGLIVGAVAGFRRLLKIQWPEPPGQNQNSDSGASRGREEGPDDSAP